MPSDAPFPRTLRFWRRRHGWSQLEFAARAGISQRHLSFLELGRASPSREMVMRLGEVLGVSLRQQNGMLTAAGFAPVWRESDIDAPELAGVRVALDRMLAQQEPYPAVVVDRRWNLMLANQGAVRLMEFLVGPLPAGAAINLADALVGPMLRPVLVNRTEVVRYFLRGVEADAAADGTAETAALLERLLAYDDVRAASKSLPPPTALEAVLPMHFRKNDVSLALFTTIATLGTPRNVTAQELRVESFFPLDDATAASMRAWAA